MRLIINRRNRYWVHRRADGYASPVRAVVATLDTLMRTRGHGRDRELFSAARQRWLHRAAVQDQRWARARIRGSNGPSVPSRSTQPLLVGLTAAS